MTAAGNQCAGPFGAVYDFYIERPWLAGTIGRLMWGTRVGALYDAIDELGAVAPGATIVDAPCGGGVALRGVRPGQDVRIIGVDISPVMLGRFGARAAARGLRSVETRGGDISALPLEDASADVFCSFSGLHMIADPKPAIAEITRVVKPGGRVLGSVFTADGSRRQRALFASGARRGHAPLHGTAAEYAAWLREAGLRDVEIRGRGFAIFGARG